MGAAIHLDLAPLKPEVGRLYTAKRVKLLGLICYHFVGYSQSWLIRVRSVPRLAFRYRREANRDHDVSPHVPVQISCPHEVYREWNKQSTRVDGTVQIVDLKGSSAIVRL